MNSDKALESAKRSPLPDEAAKSRRRRAPSSLQFATPEAPTRATSRSPGTLQLGVQLLALSLLVFCIAVVFVPRLRSNSKQKEAIGRLLPLSDKASTSAGSSFEHNLERCGSNCTAQEVEQLARNHIQHLAKQIDQMLRNSRESQKQMVALEIYPEKLKSCETKSKSLAETLKQSRTLLKKHEEVGKQLSMKTTELKACKAKDARHSSELSKLSAVRQRMQSLQDQLQEAKSNSVSWQEAYSKAHAAAENAKGNLKRCSEAQSAMQQALDSHERIFNTVSGKGDLCWKSLEDERIAMRKWQLWTAGVISIGATTIGYIFTWYKRHMQRKFWQMSSENARLSAALKSAQTGVKQRLERAASQGQ